jgi:hypothetical protein
MVTQKQLSSALSLIKTYDDSAWLNRFRRLEKAGRCAGEVGGAAGDCQTGTGRAGLLMLQLAQAKEVSAQAMKSLDSLTRSSDSEMSRAAENIRRRLDHADATWEIQAGSLDNQLDDAMNSLEVESELAARMERLGLK